MHGVVIAKCLPFTWFHRSTHSSFPCGLWYVFVVGGAYVCCDAQVLSSFDYPFMSSLCAIRVVRLYGLENDYKLMHGVVGYTFVGFYVLSFSLFAQSVNVVSFDKAGFPQDLCVRFCVSRLEMAMDTCRGGYNLDTISTLCDTILVCAALLSHPAFHNSFCFSFVFCRFHHDIGSNVASLLSLRLIRVFT